jgi:enamine deaminase RidA (YjgF/YER057c/UK114 family)
MSRIEARLADLGLVLPAPMQAPAGVVLPFRFVRIIRKRAFVAGHGPQNVDGSIAGPLGKVGRDLTVEQGYAGARLCALNCLSAIKAVIGDLDKVTRVVKVLGMVNSAAGFNRQPSVVNGCSDLILELYGAEAGAHARSAVGMAELPFDIPVEIEAEVEIDG